MILTEEQIIEIRHKCAAGTKHEFLAAEYGVRQGSISKISRGIVWPNVGGPISEVDYCSIRPTRRRRVMSLKPKEKPKRVKNTTVCQYRNRMEFTQRDMAELLCLGILAYREIEGDPDHPRYEHVERVIRAWLGECSPEEQPWVDITSFDEYVEQGMRLHVEVIGSERAALFRHAEKSYNILVAQVGIPLSQVNSMIDVLFARGIPEEEIWKYVIFLAARRRRRASTHSRRKCRRVCRPEGVAA